MNPETNQVAAAEQIEESQQIENLQTEYAVAPDGTIVKADELQDNPETPQEQLR